MIFSALVEFAHQRGIAIEPGFARKRVRWIVDLDRNGQVRDIHPAAINLRNVYFTGCPSLKQPEMLAMPSHLRHTQGIVVLQAAHFLVDTCGVATNWPNTVKETRKIVNKHQTFKVLLRLASKEVSSLKPIVAFYHDTGQLKQTRDVLQKLKSRPYDTLTFSIEGKLLIQSDSWHTWWKQFRLELDSSNHTYQGLSLISGKQIEIARTHPKIKIHDVGASGFGASLISVSSQAFESFGLEQGEHSPFDSSEATAYPAALSVLLENAPMLGHCKIVHWFEHEIPKENNPFRLLFHSHHEKDNMNSMGQIQDLLLESRQLNSKIRPLAYTKFFSMLVTGADGRVRIKSWHSSNFESVSRAVSLWQEDTRLTSFFDTVLDVHSEQLLHCLRPRQQTKRESRESYLSPVFTFVVPLYRAVMVDKTNIPLPVIFQVINALKAESASGEFAQACNPLIDTEASPSLKRVHAQLAILKVYLRRRGDTALLPKLNLDHANKAYLIGRMTSKLVRANQLYDQIQTFRAQRHRAFGLALVDPRRTLDPLIWQALQNLGRLDKTRPGATLRSLRQFLKLWKALGEILPEKFELNEQAYFALGYYQQFVFDHDQPNQERIDAKITTQDGSEN
jgi:CRISPR-associated protein Csd1